MSATQAKTAASIEVAANSVIRTVRIGANRPESKKIGANSGAATKTEHGDGGPRLEARARIGGPSGQVRDEGCEPGCRDRKGRDRDYAPERAIGPEEEERRSRRQDRGRSERREEEEAVAEVVHGTVQVSVRPARGGHVNRDDGGRYQESAGVSGHNQTDLDGRAAQI